MKTNLKNRLLVSAATMLLLFCINLVIITTCKAQASSSNNLVYYISAGKVFDGENMQQNWAVIVQGNTITAAGPKDKIAVPANAKLINYPNATLTPGLIEGHSHILLYPYNLTDWDTQVAKESDAYRTARATVHVKKTLLAGFTTARDLGSEGAGYADVAIKRAIEDGIIPGPRLMVAGRAIVATGSYGPKGYDLDQQIMIGAEEADGNNLIKVVRDQIGKGADLIKVYADYRWGLNDEAMPTFTLDELKLMNEVTKSSGRVMVAHAKTNEAMQRAILGGAATIEHGDLLNAETALLMKQKGVVYFPTLAATESVTQYKGWKKGLEPEPEAVTQKRKAFKIAMDNGVTIGMGGDVGVFAHGENVLEMELMVNYGMKPLQVLQAATSINARALQLQNKIGCIKAGHLADLVFFEGDPSVSISALRKPVWVMKDGVIYIP
ncbi:MAG: amidohydrolase [Sphingobacteriia bacterium 24-36-13]|jgi:imidazolonepropionase-like amidohydrolase|uniref:metal-dependent hydrolase family protein n=1 Tax=Sediminibacterium sp. TaxID=1917865 RepID=UPI000BC8BFA0|nr:amidohydrolase family protein [Sediminibacterium sp.]OYY09283.1 MAG: amidohydrolase [Sphingobacteriia bacterium 35-36-14]OYZ53198.1 MAG: amidohydrolase [Sphingobacteriia bacterium 24-36-13]OZA65867.1 MAG: amidohydrolase [Sphingobacteriia bacterium 39-36-14]HQS24656.1 amidohydrolase family protein [Sediminibacterium sp.]HQS34196.1 amidohydrolase family protein [Sediminibacterium sp.]